MSGYRFFEFTLRADMVEALRDYADKHYPLGDFLRLAVSNDFVGCAGRADEDNQRNLPALAAYLYNEMPGGCWGSPAKYATWLEQRKEAVNDDQQPAQP